MKNINLLFLTFFVTTLVLAQPQIPKIDWQHIDSNKAGIESPNGAEQQTSGVVFDIDKDGINDFIITERKTSPSVVWYKKNGEKWDRYILDDRPLRIEAGAAFYDIDNDGDLDPVFAGESQSNEVWWWENPYPSYDKNTPWKRRTIKKSGETKQHDQLIADFDGDGLGELVFWNQNANTLYIADIPENPKELDEWNFKPIYVYSSDGEMQPPGSVPNWKRNNEHEGLAKADIDMDGTLDIVGGGWWFKHIGDHKFTANIVDASYSFSRSAAGQLIEGGRPEILLVVGDGIAPMFIYEWKDGTWAKKTLIAEVDNGHSLDLIDFNGDGHLDIFNAEMRFNAEYNPDAKCRILLGDGKGNFTDYIINEGFSHHESRIADLDGDGDYDIFSKPYAYRAPGFDIFLQNGTGQPLSIVKGVGFDKPVGLQLYSLRYEFKKGVPNTLQKIADMGITQVEVSSYYGYEPKEFKKLLKKYKMKVPSMIFGYDKFKNDFETITNEAKLFGAKYVGVGWMPHERGNFTIEDAKRNCAEMNEFAAKCKKKGLNFFYHLHGYEFGNANGQLMIDYLMENTSEDLTFEMDAMWTMYGGCDPVWLMKKYGHRIGLIHLKDMRWGIGPIHTGGAPDPTSVALGQGQVNIPAILRLAKEKGSVLFIIEDEAENAIDQIPQSLEFIERMR
ncbi:FG-GAP-like repeat-containing protein [Draconibacterium sp.]|nr:FG-GAP-like repeat-containing protein [Draconibacterium sp.]